MISPFLIVVVLALVISSLSATAVQVIQGFARHELEEYCRRRGKLEWFGRIVDQREELTIGAQIVQMITLATAVSCGFVWYFEFENTAEPTTVQFVTLLVVVSFIMLMVGCWIPWGVLRFAAPSFLYRTWRIWWLAAVVLQPLFAGVELVTLLFHRATGKEVVEEDEEEAFEEEIRSIVSEGERDGVLEADVREMIESVIELDDSTVRKVMTPRSRVDGLNAHSDWNQMIDFVVQCKRTRIPVFRESFRHRTDVVGILFVKDLLAEFPSTPENRRSLSDLVRQPLFVAQSMSLDRMLQQFLEERTHMAIVFDEYDTVAGVVTIEDILEEIVGEIIDETDSEMPAKIQRLSDRSVEVDGNLSIDDLNAEMGLDLPTNGEFDTVAGLLMDSLGKIPVNGQEIDIEDIRFVVCQASRRSVDRVRVSWMGEPEREDRAARRSESN